MKKKTANWIYPVHSEKVKAYEHFKKWYELEKDYSRSHWNAEEQREHRTLVEYLKYACEALEESIKRDMSVFDPD